MNFTPIASSSKGNAYLLESEGVEPLLIEAGIPIKQLREKLHFGLSGLAGCLVSHEHGDHSRAVKDLLKTGVDCYMSTGTAKSLGVENHHRTNIFKSSYSMEQIGSWGVFTFPLEHDAAEPTGFFIACKNDDDRCLFVPDTGFLKNRFNGITILCIECNNIEGLLSKNIIEGHIPAVVGHRVRRSHMSLERVVTMLKANDLSLCRQIYLLHLSDTNSSEKIMRKKVQEATGVPVSICKA